MKSQINLASTKEKLMESLEQAKESLKLLNVLQKETVEKARTMIKVPEFLDRKHLLEKKILPQLKKLGVASHGEVEALRKRVKDLEALLEKKNAS